MSMNLAVCVGTKIVSGVEIKFGRSNEKFFEAASIVFNLGVAPCCARPTKRRVIAGIEILTKSRRYPAQMVFVLRELTRAYLNNEDVCVMLG